MADSTGARRGLECPAVPHHGPSGALGSADVIGAPYRYNSSRRASNAPTSRARCVPVSTRAKGYPFEVPLPEGVPVQRVAFADQVKSLDWRTHHARPVAVLPATVLASLFARTRAVLE